MRGFESLRLLTWQCAAPLDTCCHLEMGKLKFSGRNEIILVITGGRILSWMLCVRVTKSGRIQLSFLPWMEN